MYIQRLLENNFGIKVYVTHDKRSGSNINFINMNSGSIEECTL